SARARAARHPTGAAGAHRRRPHPRPGHAGGAPGRAADRPDPQGVRRARGAAARRRCRGLQRGAAGTGLGRPRRPVHHHGPGDGAQPAPQARRPAAHRDRGRVRLPDHPGRYPVTTRRPVARRPRPTLRLRLTVFDAVLLTGAAALLLAVQLALADGHVTGGAAALWYGTVALLVVSGLGVVATWVVVGRALRPLKRVTAIARRLGGQNLDERIGYAGPDDEVAELAATFDAMLGRLADAFDAQRRFVANASHELRTPLAVIRTEVDVTLSAPDADLAEYRHMARVVRDASQRASGLVEALLVLARSEAQSGRRLARRVPADLAAS